MLTTFAWIHAKATCRIEKSASMMLAAFAWRHEKSASMVEKASSVMLVSFADILAALPWCPDKTTDV